VTPQELRDEAQALQDMLGGPVAKLDKIVFAQCMLMQHFAELVQELVERLDAPQP
jgi:hypothetical protein